MSSRSTPHLAALLSVLVAGCERTPEQATATPRPSASLGAAVRALPPLKVERKEAGLGTTVHFIAYTNDQVGERETRAAIDAALGEIRRLEALLSEWREESDVGRVNAGAGEWVTVAAETLAVIERGLDAGQRSDGTFDITFQAMHDVWKFGSARDEPPLLPRPAAVARRRALIDYRKVEVDRAGGRVRIPKGHAIGLGGIAKGYIVDRAASVLSNAKVRSFLVQAGGDLYGAGRKPDGSRWVSGIQDPRGPQGSFFATLELEDHAFSTAGDYARSYVLGGRRYHHIIDPRTGYPATASRSVTVWAKDAITADAIDDAVFILGPEKGLKLADSLDGVGVVIVDARNKVWTSRTLQGRVQVLKEPTDGI